MGHCSGELRRGRRYNTIPSYPLAWTLTRLYFTPLPLTSNNKERSA